jgi:hypothetical protein
MNDQRDVRWITLSNNGHGGDDARVRPQPNTGNLGLVDDVDQVGWRLDQVTVDGFLGGKRGAVGPTHDAGVVPAAACVESLEHLSDHGADGVAQPGGGEVRPGR